jgi:hypothetical protein
MARENHNQLLQQAQKQPENSSRNVGMKVECVYYKRKIITP